MLFKVIYANEVFDDLQKAIDYYNSRKKGLGSRFYKTVKIQISEIQSNGLGYQIRYKTVRCAPLKTFPYTIYYSIHQDTKTIMVIALFCDYRDPKIWKFRLK
ncbi:MAG: type II toxin-antitoxin system RelE/ParE family toxin [Lutibacter sp.]|nr:type II toxin-antitoxin system RelE/ParE family toxin [Lutibacter sp.]